MGTTTIIMKIFLTFCLIAATLATANEVFEDTADYGMNFFSSMTEDEKSQYLGLNITGHEATFTKRSEDHDDLMVNVPSEKLWVKGGAVTAVKNQGSCGSCWTFGAVGGLETRYKAMAGRLRSFAEQEYLDCVYEGRRDGCNGGWPDDAYDYSRKNGGRLAATASYPYTAKDGRCKGRSSRNDLVAYKITGYTSVGRTEQANIVALASGSLSVAFEVTNKFQQYRGGIMRDTSCRGQPNHAVTSVGYTKSFVLVKNSWGSQWGDHGFVKFARGYSNCGLFKYSSYPKLVSTGKSDVGKEDKATDYIPSDDDKPDPGPKPDPNCKDRASNCAEIKDYCGYGDIATKWCRKTCGKCSGG